MPPLYVLDTDICSYIIKNKPLEARQRMNRVPLRQQALSVVTYAELLFGVRRSSNARVNQTMVDNFARHLNILDWDRNAAEHYADLRARLETAGTPIGPMDMDNGTDKNSFDIPLTPVLSRKEREPMHLCHRVYRYDDRRPCPKPWSGRGHQ